MDDFSELLGGHSVQSDSFNQQASQLNGFICGKKNQFKKNYKSRIFFQFRLQFNEIKGKYFNIAYTPKTEFLLYKSIKKHFFLIYIRILYMRTCV